MATVERVSHVASGVRVSGLARMHLYLECPVSLVSGTTSHCDTRPAGVLMRDSSNDSSNDSTAAATTAMTAAMTAGMTAAQLQQQ